MYILIKKEFWFEILTISNEFSDTKKSITYLRGEALVSLSPTKSSEVPSSSSAVERLSMFRLPHLNGVALMDLTNLTPEASATPIPLSWCEFSSIELWASGSQEIWFMANMRTEAASAYADREDQTLRWE